ncbi:MAG: TrmH family RNA methyltransferase [Patescibacteria group bacterium]
MEKQVKTAQDLEFGAGKSGEVDAGKTLAFEENKPRNVADHLKWLSAEETEKYLNEQKLNFSVLILNVLYDNNAGNIVRSANAFGAQEIILYGHRKFDRRASVGAEFYSRFKHIKFVEDLDALFAEYESVVAIENTPDAVSLKDFSWDGARKTLMIFGQESAGIPEEILKKCQATVAISQRGSVRSLNVAVAAGIAMNDYCTKTS